MSSYYARAAVLTLEDIVYLRRLATNDAQFAAILNKLNDDIDFIVDLHTEEEDE